MTNLVRSYIGIGSNLDDPVARVRAGLAALRGIPASTLVACSCLYRTMPIGITDQPEFINAAAVLDTPLAPAMLLQELLAIERTAGRRRGPVQGGPRTLDLDLLLYGDLEMRSADVTIPHPRMHERAFVLAPLFEIAPTLRIPGKGAVSMLLGRCETQSVFRLTDDSLAGVSHQ
jgi:2-amino-4-hydroxy-6-hydroxymethyldihydropteridine diphosphokinase